MGNLATKLALSFVAGACNAFMDTSADHYGSSVLSKWNPQYWSKAVSWVNKYRRPKWLPVMFTDSWHLFKEISLFAIFNAGGLPTPLVWWMDVIACRVSFGVGFVLFYNYILPLKSSKKK